VPIYHKCLVIAAKYNFNRTTAFYEYILRHLQHRFPFWNRTEGRDHIFLFPSGSGPSAFRHWRDRIPHSIFLTPEADKTRKFRDEADYFDSWKDIIIPGYVSTRMYLKIQNHSLPMNQRKRLLMYRGDKKSFARQQVSKLGRWCKSMNISTEEIDIGGGTYMDKYLRLIRSTKFCIVPAGYSAWTNRLFETLLAGCIPVVVSDKIRFPYEDILDYRRLLVKWPEHQVGSSLIDHLKSYSPKELSDMQQSIIAVQHLFYWNTVPPEHGPFGLIMQELAKKTLRTRNGDHTFWSHGRSFNQ